MDEKQIAQLRAFAKVIVAHVINDYGSFLSEEKKKSLNEAIIIPDNYYKHFTGPANIQGEVIRLVFNKVFENIECTKSIDFSDGTKKDLLYGSFLKEGLVEYYTNELAVNHKFTIDNNEMLKDNLQMVQTIKEVLGDNFNNTVLNSNAIDILNVVNNPELTKKCDGDAVKRYIAELNKAKELKNEEQIVENVKGKGKVFPPFYANGIQYIKYKDENGTIHIIKSANPKVVSSTYKDMINSLAPGEEIDSQKLFQALKKHGETVPMYTENDINSSKLSSEESNMLDTIYSDRDLLFKANNSKEAMTHSSDASVHTIGEEVVITDQNKYGKVTSQEFKETSSTDPVLNPDEVTTPRLITEEEYEKLCMKSVNNKPLTQKELREMEYFDRYYFGESEIVTNTPVKEEVITKKLEQTTLPNKKNAAFAQKFLPIFIVFLTILVGAIVGIAVFRVKNPY